MRRIHLHPPRETALGLRHDDTLIAPARPVLGEPVELSLLARADAGLRRVELRAAPDGEEERTTMEPVARDGALVRFAATVRPRVARFRYRFRLHFDDGVRHLTMRGLARFDPIDAFDFTLHARAPGEPGPPDWPLDAIAYQIFPDRFAEGDPRLRAPDGAWSIEGTPLQQRPFGAPPLPWLAGKNADFYGGDLPGIEARLDHVAGLGATCLYLNPIHPALTNHRYDHHDHGGVDPHLGGDAALGSLAAALRARDMRLVLDVVLNHTGSAHPWFNREGRAGEGGAYRDPASPSRAFYSFDEWPDGYRTWLGHRHLPRLNLAEPALRAILFGAPDALLRRFLRPPFSVDGYRFDCANVIGRDGAEQAHRALWAELARALREARPDAWLFGEHFFDPEKLLKGDGLDGVMAYHAFTFPTRAFASRRDRDGAPSPLDGRALLSHLREAWARLGWSAWRRSMLHVNTHDLPRLQTEAGGPAFELATALQLALPGVPCLYYGDEIGLEGGADPDNRRCMEWDEARWNAARLRFVKGAIARRRGSAALRRGGLVDLGGDEDVLAFARVLGSEAVVVVASRAAEPVEVALELGGLGVDGDRVVRLAPMSAALSDLAT